MDIAKGDRGRCEFCREPIYYSPADQVDIHVGGGRYCLGGYRLIATRSPAVRRLVAAYFRGLDQKAQKKMEAGS